jgi:ferredoxin-NADP reductase
MSSVAKLNVRVAEVVEVNELIKRFRFVARDGSELPAFSGGAHTVVEMDDHGTRRLNPYSLMSDPEDRSGYEISVRRDDQGRGGSLYMHRHVKPGMEMTLSYPVNLFSLDGRAKKHLMIAGGIGITPFLAQIAQLSHFGGKFELHYSARTPSLGAYMDRLTAAHPDRVHCYFDDQKQVIDLKTRACDPADRHASLRLRPEGDDQLGPVDGGKHGLAQASAAPRGIPRPRHRQTIRSRTGGKWQDHHRRHHSVVA